MSNDGRFVWHELLTSDPDTAQAFYTEVAGWKTMRWDGPEGMPAYSVCWVGDNPIGGIMELDDETKKRGVAPQWVGYVQVADVDATAARASELGGKVIVPPTDVPTVGRFTVIVDPRGAALGPVKPRADMDLHSGPPRVGDFGWDELNSTDYEASWALYSDLFDWKRTDTMDMGAEMDTYQTFNRAGAAEDSMGGMSNAAKQQGMRSNWLHYIKVDDINAAIGRVKGNGGQVMDGQRDIPGGGKIAQCRDPQNVSFGLVWNGGASK